MSQWSSTAIDFILVQLLPSILHILGMASWTCAPYSVLIKHPKLLTLWDICPQQHDISVNNFSFARNHETIVALFSPHGLLLRPDLCLHITWPPCDLGCTTPKVSTFTWLIPLVLNHPHMRLCINKTLLKDKMQTCLDGLGVNQPIQRITVTVSKK